MNKFSFYALSVVLLVSCEREPLVSVTHLTAEPEKEQGEVYRLIPEEGDRLVGKSVDVVEQYVAADLKTEAVNEEGKRAVMGSSNYKRERRLWLQYNSPGKLKVYPLKVALQNDIYMGGKKLELPPFENKLEGKSVEVRRGKQGYVWAKMGKEEEAVLLGLKPLLGEHDAAVYGAEPRAVGGRWKVEPGALMSTVVVGESYEGVAWMKFEKVAQFRGFRCAYFSFEVDAVSSSEAGEDYVLASGRIIRAIDYGVDLYFGMNLKNRAKMGFGSTGESSYRCEKKIIFPKKS